MKKLSDAVLGLLMVLGLTIIAIYWLGDGPQNMPAPSSRQPNIGAGPPGDYVRTTTQAISSTEFGASWPFTVGDAVLVCVPELKGAGAFVVVAGQPFAATGAASTVARRHSLDIIIDGMRKRPVLFNADEPAADRLWAEAPRPVGLKPDERWHKVSFGTVITALDRMGCGGL